MSNKKEIERNCGTVSKQASVPCSHMGSGRNSGKCTQCMPCNCDTFSVSASAVEICALRL